MKHIYFPTIVDENGNDNYYLYSPWLIENVYSPNGKQQWKWVYRFKDNFPTSIIFYRDEDALAFRLTFGL